MYVIQISNASISNSTHNYTKINYKMRNIFFAIFLISQFSKYFSGYFDSIIGHYKS